MQYHFLSPQKKRLAVNVQNPVLGDGPTGKKSDALRRHRGLIEGPDSGLNYVPNVAITPSSFHDFLRRARASFEDPRQSRLSLYETEFTPSELDMFREAMRPFDGLYIAVRSDEATAAGVGLWHTDFMLADGSTESVREFAAIATAIIYSDYENPVIAFKKRVGIPLEHNTGILVMPVVGMPMDAIHSEDPDKNKTVFSSPYSFNVITGFVDGDHLLAIGTGLGGANNYGAKTMTLSTLAPNHLVFERKSSNVLRSKLLVSGSMERMSTLSDYRLDGFSMGWKSLEGLAAHLKKAVSLFHERAGAPRYLELALNPIGENPLSVVQCAEIALPNVEKPDVNDKQKLYGTSGRSSRTAHGREVLGRGVVETETVAYLKYDEDEKSHQEHREELEKLNAQAKNYFLVLDYFHLAHLVVDNFNLFSNASVIFVRTDDLPKYDIATHLSGSFREAGIIVLVGDENSFDIGLNKGINKRRLLTYAHDGKQEAFVAVMD